MAEQSRNKLLDTIKGLLASGDHSDATITCQGETFKVHKNIVCTRSDYFKKALSNFPGKEKDSSHTDLPEENPETVKLLLQYLYEAEYEPHLPIRDPITPAVPKRPTWNDYMGSNYTYEFPHTCLYDDYRGIQCRDACICPHHLCGENCTYSCQNFDCDTCNPKQLPAPTIEGAADQLVTHAKMYEIADRFFVEGLKDLCKEKFSRACNRFWNDDHFATASYHVFTTTPDEDNGLRDIVSKTIADHMSLTKKPAVAALLMEFNGLAYGLLMAKLAQGWK